MATQTETIVCKSPTCEQVIAVKHPSGDVRPVVIGAWQDKRKRMTVRCPVCGEINYPGSEASTNWRSPEI